MKSNFKNVLMSYNKVIEAGQVLRTLVQQHTAKFSENGYTPEMLAELTSDLDDLAQMSSDKIKLDAISMQSIGKKQVMAKIKSEIKYFKTFGYRLKYKTDVNLQVFNGNLPKHASFVSLLTIANDMVDAMNNYPEVLNSIGIKNERIIAFKKLVTDMLAMRTEQEVKVNERSEVAFDRNELIDKVYNEMKIISEIGKQLFRNNPAIVRQFNLSYTCPRYVSKTSPPEQTPGCSLTDFTVASMIR